ncbi:hypothetical protein DZI70_23030 [Escherichia coli]|nr:hypothetical protein [Escherichia coli]
MSIYIDGRDCCQTGQFSQDVADGALTLNRLSPPFPVSDTNVHFRSKGTPLYSRYLRMLFAHPHILFQEYS